MVPVIDSHQHLWDPATHGLEPLTGKYAVLRRRSTVDELAPLAAAAGVDRTVAVQAESSATDTIGLLALAGRGELVGSVVGWVDPYDPEPDAALGLLLGAPGGETLVGIRLNARDQADPDWLLSEPPLAVAQSIASHGLVVEYLMRHQNLDAIRALRARIDATIVIDHLMTFPADRGERAAWQAGVAEVAALPGVFLKVSGFIDDPGPAGWRPDDFGAAVAHALAVVDHDRLMFGTDWPVSTLATTYEQIVEWTRTQLDQLSSDEQQQVLGGNAIRCYGLDAAGGHRAITGGPARI